VRPHIETLEKQREVAVLDIQTTGDELPAAETTWRAVVRENARITTSLFCTLVVGRLSSRSGISL